MKAKKLLTNMLCVSIVASNITPVLATVANDTLTFEDTDTSTSKQTEVLYERAGSYFVTIPKTISLGADKQSKYFVKVEGDIPSDRQVYVSPIDGIKETENFDFYMHDTNTSNPKADVVATITQNKFYWDFSEVANGYTETNNKVMALDLTSGTWKGTFDFEINMKAVDSNESHIHSYTETIIKNATCTEDGEKELICSCGDTKTESIPATGHNIEDGNCTECDVIVKTVNDLLSGDVSFNRGTVLAVDKADTLKVNDIVIPEQNFTFDEEGTYQVTVETTDPDTNSPIIININITIIINQETHTHNYTETIIKEATCTEAGEKKLTCSCGDSKTETIPATGHDYVDGTCKNCGEAEYIQHEHNYVSKTFNVDWVRDSDGSSGYKWVYDSSTATSTRYKSNEPTGIVGSWNKAETTWKITVPISCTIQVGFKPNTTSTTVNPCAYIYLNDKEIWNNNESYASSKEYKYKYVTLQPGDNYVKAIGYSNDCIELFKVTGEYEVCNICGEKPLSKIWNYTLNETDKTITLNRYIGEETDIIVNSSYLIDGTTYKTKIAANAQSWSTDYMFGRTSIKTVKFEKNIELPDSIAGMFRDCSSLTNVDISNLDTSNVTDMSNMFLNCTSLISLDVSNFDTSNVMFMNSMFNGCSGLTSLDVSNFSTSNVTNMYRMFYKCSSLTSLDLSNFDTLQVTNMDSIFYGCTSLNTIYVTQNKWFTSQANITNMFKNCGTSSVTYK